MTVKYMITNLDRKAEDGTVIAVYWRAFMQDSQYSASLSGVINLTKDDSSEFIKFEDLTEDVVVGWVKNNVSTEEIETDLIAQIEKQKAPIELSGLPWTATTLGDPISVE